MSVYLKKFETTSAYETYIASEDKVLPNVSFCEDERGVHYNPHEELETRLVAVYDVINTEEDMLLFSSPNYSTAFSSVEIDGVMLPNIPNTYRFDTVGEHVVKYGLTDPTTIKTALFAVCSRLTSITIPNSVTSIGGGAFSYCDGLTSVTIPNSVTSIGESAFFGCSELTSVNIPNSVTSIGVDAFSYCNDLTSVTINSTSILNDAQLVNIFGDQVTTYVIGNGVTSIGDYAFQSYSNLTSITIPNSVTSIGNSAFEGCTGLTSITIPNSVTSIGNYAFENCSGLTSITIPNSVTSIGYGAFRGCSGLTSVTVEATTPPTLLDTDMFDNDCPIYVPSESVETYKAASNWSEYADRIQAIS